MTLTILVLIALTVTAVSGETNGFDPVHDETLMTKDIEVAKASLLRSLKGNRNCGDGGIRAHLGGDGLAT